MLNLWVRAVLVVRVDEDVLGGLGLWVGRCVVVGVEGVDAPLVLLDVAEVDDVLDEVVDVLLVGVLVGEIEVEELVVVVLVDDELVEVVEQLEEERSLSMLMWY